MASPELQNDINSPEGLKTFIEKNEYTIQKWSISNTQRFEGNPTTGLATGTVTFTNGKEATIEVHCVIGPNATWQIKGLKFGP